MIDNKSVTLLAFDHGLKKIGVARVDTYVRIVEPLGEIENDDFDSITGLIDEHQPAELIVGLPRGLEGQETEQTRHAREFAEKLAKYLLPVRLQDEALTSEMARSKMKSGQSEHAVAASIILEDYLRENR